VNRSRQKGFTLIELLVVIAIIGVLSSVVLASLNSARGKADTAKRLSDGREIQKALELYATDHAGQYPSTGGNWHSQCSVWGSYGPADVAPGLVPTYISEFPDDPDSSGSGTCCYIYRSNATDYKLLIPYDCRTEVDYQQYPSLLDPYRDYGSDPSAVEPGHSQAYSWAIYTPGAAAW
jgi:prepilin-type N-terminal cleavage/methylation domain-containing protein